MWSPKVRIALKPFCKVCHDAGKDVAVYTSHHVRESPAPDSRVVCPTLLTQSCNYCHVPGHTISYCPKLKLSTRAPMSKEEEDNKKESATTFHTDMEDAFSTAQTHYDNMARSPNYPLHPDNLFIPLSIRPDGTAEKKAWPATDDMRLPLPPSTHVPHVPSSIPPTHPLLPVDDGSDDGSDSGRFTTGVADDVPGKKRWLGEPPRIQRRAHTSNIRRSSRRSTTTTTTTTTHHLFQPSQFYIRGRANRMGATGATGATAYGIREIGDGGPNPKRTRIIKIEHQ